MLKIISNSCGEIFGLQKDNKVRNHNLNEGLKRIKEAIIKPTRRLFYVQSN